MISSSAAKEFFLNSEKLLTQNVKCKTNDNEYLLGLLESKQRKRVSELQCFFIQGGTNPKEEKSDEQRKTSNITVLSKRAEIALKNRTRPLPVPPLLKKEQLVKLPELPPRDEVKDLPPEPLPRDEVEDLPPEPLPRDEVEDLPPPVPPRDEEFEDRPLPGLPVDLPITVMPANIVFENNSFLKRSFIAVYQFARSVFSFIGLTMYGMCNKFKNITLICIGPFRFSRKVNTNSSSIPKAPVFKPGEIPPAPHFNGFTKIKSDVLEDDAFQEHILKKPLEVSENVQDVTRFANSKIIERRALMEFEDDVNESDEFDDESDWEFSFDFSNGAQIVCEAESEDNITARLQHDLNNGKTEVKTYNNLSKKQIGKTQAISNDLLSQVVLKKEKDRPVAEKQEKESEKPDVNKVFTRVMSKFLDIFDDEGNLDDDLFEDDDEEYSFN